MSAIVFVIFVFIFVTNYLDQEPGWPISSHAYFGAPRPEEVAPLAQKISVPAPPGITLMAGEAIAPPKSYFPDPRSTYIPAREHFGTIRSADLTPASKPRVPYWPIFSEPADKVEQAMSDWKKAPFAYAYRDDSGKWKVTTVQPIDQTPWYRIW